MKKNKRFRTSIYLFPASLAVLFMSSILVIISPLSSWTLISVPSPTHSIVPVSTDIDNQAFYEQIGYIENAYTIDGKNYIDIDYIQWQDDNSAPNDYRIANDNSEIRTFEVINEAPIYLVEFTPTGVVTPTVSFDELIEVINNSSPNYHLGSASGPFWVNLNSLNQVTKITEQYIP